MRVVRSVALYRRVLDIHIYGQMKSGGISRFEDVFGKQGGVDRIVPKSEGCEKLYAGVLCFLVRSWTESGWNLS